MNAVTFHVDTEYAEDLDELDFGKGASIRPDNYDPDVVLVTIEDVDDVLVEGLNDGELAEFFGISEEGLIYTDRG